MPIIMGGNSSLALSRAARLGDGWLVSGSMSPDDRALYRRAVLEQRPAHKRSGPFETIARTDRVSQAAVEEFRAEGFDELVLWAYQVWVGRSAEERRERLAATAETCGI
jgi:alkanesulfonate monooxygenase SsuD/methylene tetrahydromethanopterin reductase-like flavin-dependent oxidoreductase (luciferase family)